MSETRKRWRWPVIGAIAGAIGASACCWGPLVLVAFGMTGAWVGSLSALDPFRPFFMIASAGLLGISFYRVYRKRKPTCDSEAACSESTISKLSRGALWGGTILVVLLFAFPYVLPALYAGNADATTDLELDGDVIADTSSVSVANTPPDNPAVPEEVAAVTTSEDPVAVVVDMATVVLQVERLTCASCTVAARSRLISLAGVTSARVTLKPPHAVIQYDPAIVSVDELAIALTSIGYPAQSVTSGE